MASAWTKFSRLTLVDTRNFLQVELSCITTLRAHIQTASTAMSLLCSTPTRHPACLPRRAQPQTTSRRRTIFTTKISTFFFFFMYLANGFLGRRRLMRWLGATPPASFAPYGNDDDTSRAGSGPPLLDDYDPLTAREGCTILRRRCHVRMHRRGLHWRRLSCTDSWWRRRSSLHPTAPTLRAGLRRLGRSWQERIRTRASDSLRRVRSRLVWECSHTFTRTRPTSANIRSSSSLSMGAA